MTTKAKPKPRRSANKRPPLAWDGVKTLKFPIVIYCKGKLYAKVVAYDIDNLRFAYMLPSGLVEELTNVNFIVKRLA